MHDDIKTCVLHVRYSSNNQTEQSIEGSFVYARISAPITISKSLRSMLTGLHLPARILKSVCPSSK